jgi:hypothetical protein
MNSNAIRLSASALVFWALAIGGGARATTFDFTGAVQTFDVLTTGIYDITAAGGQGGFGGGGAVIGGDVKLTAGETVIILVGEGDTPTSGAGAGGGGGTFVSLSPAGPSALDNLLVVAGGGGGGDDGNANGGLGLASGAGTGDGGGGGIAGGGGGFLGGGGLGGGGASGGGSGYSGGMAAGGTGDVDGGAGGAGGGGGPVNPLYTIGGGGGGYTGGDGSDGCPCAQFGGGGSSYLIASATEAVSTAGGNSGDGYVTIDYVGPAVPETSTWAMILLGFAVVSLAGCRISRKAAAGAEASPQPSPGGRVFATRPSPPAASHGRA